MEFLELKKTPKNNVQWVRLNSRVEGTEERNHGEGGREGDARGKRNGNILYMYN